MYKPIKTKSSSLEDVRESVLDILCPTCTYDRYKCTPGVKKACMQQYIQYLFSKDNKKGKSNARDI